MARRKTRRGGVKTRSQRKKEDASRKAKVTARAESARKKLDEEIAVREENVARSAAMAKPSTGAWAKYVQAITSDD